MKNQEDKLDTADANETPAWLTDALRVSREAELFCHAEGNKLDHSEGFHPRCEQAAAVAFSMAKLRSERKRIGFVPLSLVEYIQGLTKVANVSLAPILTWLGGTEISASNSNTARALAKIAREIGIGLRQTLAHARIGFAARLGSAPVALLAARRRSASGARNQLQECEIVLRQVESEYDLNRIKELRQIEAEIRSAYNEGTSSVA